MLNAVQLAALNRSLAQANASATIRTTAGEPYIAPERDLQVSVSFVGADTVDTTARAGKILDSNYNIEAAVYVATRNPDQIEADMVTLVNRVYTGLQRFEQAQGFPTSIEVGQTYEDNPEYRTANILATFRHFVEAPE